MQTARRLYVYLISGVGLGVLVAGVTMLLTVLLDRLGLDAPVLGGQGDVMGQQLTLASALTVVGLPVWLIHWAAAERSVRPDRADAALERTSDVRGLYFAVAMGLLLLAMAGGLSSVITAILSRLVGAGEFSGAGLANGLALTLTAGSAWAYHVRIRTRDWARGAMTGGGAWLPRTYLYLAAFVGLLILLGAVGGLIDVVVRLVVDRPPDFSEPGIRWWAYPLGQALTGIIVGGGIWLGHAMYAERLVRDPGWRGQSERPARLRVAYFVGVLIATAAGSIYFVADALGRALTGLLGADTAEPFEIVVSLMSAVPFVGAWWLHARRMHGEADASDAAARRESGNRLLLYSMALVGLAFGAVAVAIIGALLVDLVAGGSRVLAGADAARSQLVRAVPFALIAVSVWGWAWRGIGLRAAADPDGESTSTIRRTMLLIVLAASVIAGVVAAAIVLYRLFGSVFGVEQGGDAIGELSRPLSALVVAGAVAAYHAVQLRRDQARRASAAASLEAAPAGPPASRGVLALLLSGPPDGDLASVAQRLREELPPGFSLEVGGPPA